MAIAFVQKAPNTTTPTQGNNVSSVSVTFGTTPTAGDLVTVAIGNGATSTDILQDVSTVADNQGNGNYTRAVALADGEAFGTSGAQAAGVFIYYAENILAGASFQITVTMAGATFFDVGAQEWSGVATSGSLGPTSTNSGSSTSPSTGAMAPSGSALYLGIVASLSQSNVTWTAGQTELFNQGSNTVEAADCEYFLGSGSQNLTWTLGSSSGWAACGATFLAPSGAAPQPPRPILFLLNRPHALKGARPFMGARAPLPATVGPVTNTWAMTAGLSFTGGGPVRAVSTGLSGGLSFTGAIVRAVSTHLTAGLSFVGALTRAITHALAAAALSFAGAVVKATSHGLTAGLSFVGSIPARAIHTGLTAGLSFVGAVTKAITKSALTATLSFTGAFARTAGKALSGGLSFVGSIPVRAIHTGLSAALSFAGGLTRFITKAAMTATLSFTGALASTKLFFRTLTAALSFTGAGPGRAVSTHLAGGLSFAGNLARAISTHLTAGLSFVGAIAKQVSRPLAAALSFTGAIKTQFGRTFTAGLSFAGGLARRTSTGLSGGLSFVGAIARTTSTHLASAALSFVGALVESRLYQRVLTAALSFSGAISRQTSTGLSAALSFAGALRRAITTTLPAAALSFAGSLTKTASTHLAAALSFSGSLAAQGFRLFHQALTAALSFSGSFAKQAQPVLRGSLGFVGSIPARVIGKALSGGLSFAGLLAHTPRLIQWLLEALVYPLMSAMTVAFADLFGEGVIVPDETTQAVTTTEAGFANEALTVPDMTGESLKVSG